MSLLQGLFTLRRPAATTRPRPRSRRRRYETPARRLLRILGGLAIAIVLIPLILTPLYTFVRPASTVMLVGWFTGQPVDRRWIALDDMAPILPRTIITAEDGRYCAHYGVDWSAISDVLDTAEGAPRGASTITMQTVKNLFLWTSRSYVRKLFEVPLAYYADLILGKHRILEIYLNVAQWGPGIFGAEAAARYYFNRPAAGLDARQAALLAAALPNPLIRNPARASPRLQHLARVLANRAARTAADTSCIDQ